MRHCKEAASYQSMFDALWSEVLLRTVIRPNSALGFALLVTENRIFPEFSGLEGCFERSQEGLRLLSSHVLAHLNIITEEDVSKLPFSAEHPEMTIDKENLQVLFQHVAKRGDTLNPTVPPATALHIAIERGNRAAVDMILQASRITANTNTMAILYTREGGFGFPIIVAVLAKSPSMIKTLLKADRYQFSPPETANCAEEEAFVPYVSDQWILQNYGSPALHMAMLDLAEDDLINLIDVAKPKDINMQDRRGEAALHIAVWRNQLKLVRALVKKYNANVDAVDNSDWTIGFTAFMGRDTE